MNLVSLTGIYLSDLKRFGRGSSLRDPRPKRFLSGENIKTEPVANLLRQKIKKRLWRVAKISQKTCLD
jgi:hypothetical protein